jgi:predicted nuclease of predicted toxin-antitoxin system
MKLLVDMNLSPRWVGLLTGAGTEAAHWSSLGPVNASDPEIKAFAKANGHVVLTHALDFSAILAATQGDKPSVAQIRSEDVSPEAIRWSSHRRLAAKGRRTGGRRSADRGAEPDAVACSAAAKTLPIERRFRAFTPDQIIGEGWAMTRSCTGTGADVNGQHVDVLEITTPFQGRINAGRTAQANRQPAGSIGQS